MARSALPRIPGYLAAVLAAGLVMPTPASATTAPLAAAPAATVFVSTTGSDRNDCTKRAPCASFDAAYSRAPAGAIVEVAGGTYPTQVIKAVADKGTPKVLFRPAPNAKVLIDDELDVFASHLEFRDMSMDVWYVKPGASDVTLRRLNTGLLFITSATNIRVLGGDVGPWQNTSSQIKACSGCAQIPTGILIDSVRFHDYTRTDEKAHDECLEVYPAASLTIRRSTFRNCAIMDLLISGYNRQQPHDILIENNYFDRPGSEASALSAGYYSLYIDSRAGTVLQNILIRNNSALATMYIATGGVTVNNVAFIANIGPRRQRHCYKGVVFAHNVWNAARCSSTDQKAPPAFVDPRKLDLRLLPGAAAINRGDPSSFPLVDKFGRKRPHGRLPDAGAVEAR